MDMSVISDISRIAILGMFLNACGGGGGDGEQVGGNGELVGGDIDQVENLPPPPQIAGIWSGTWEGIDTAFGPAAGTWEARISQQGSEIKGPIIFGGDIDCAEGSMTGTADAETEVVSGQVVRNPCPSNDWLFTAFNQDENTASGTWEKALLSNGSFEGQRIATFTGPVISYVYPPAGRVGAYLTIVGERLAMDAATDSLMLGENGTSLVPLTSSDSLISLQLPGNISTPEQLVLTTALGKALSPRYFNTEPTNPNTVVTQNIPLDTSNATPTGIHFSVNGRRAFVTNPNDGSVIMINTEMGEEWTSRVLLPTPSLALPAGPSPINPVHAVTVNPNGRHIYVAGHNHVFVVHAHTLELIRTITVLADNGPLLSDLNPHGIAISPDGRWLLVSQALDGGSVTILDLENNFSIFDTLVMEVGNFPHGIAVSPDNTHAYIAVSGIDNEIRVYNLKSAALEPTLSIGDSPTAIAVTADANRIYVVNTATNTVNYLD